MKTIDKPMNYRLTKFLVELYFCWLFIGAVILFGGRAPMSEYDSIPPVQYRVWFDQQWVQHGLKIWGTGLTVGLCIMPGIWLLESISIMASRFFNRQIWPAIRPIDNHLPSNRVLVRASVSDSAELLLHPSEQGKHHSEELLRRAETFE